MTISNDDPDLFLAILSMDAYNRGYNAALGNPQTGLSGNQLGNATLLNITLPVGFESASFFAQAYTWNGQTVISYRGTDQPSTDILKGFWTGGGDILDAQAEMAADF
jgi:hypothetical protein